MPKPIALFDIDNTMYKGFSYFELLEEQMKEGLVHAQVVANAKASMQKYRTGLSDYETTIVELLDIYAAGIKGKEYKVILESAKRFYQNSDKFFPYVEPIIKELQRSHDIALVTGEPQFVAEAVADRFGLTSYYATEYEVSEGIFTGDVKNYLASRHEKHNAIKQLMHGHNRTNSFAFGDSEGDIDMLRAVKFAICLNSTDGLRAVAEQEHWYLPQTEEVPALVKELLGRTAHS